MVGAAFTGAMTPVALSTRSRTVRSSAIRDLLRLTERPDILSLAGGLPAPELLPVDRIAAATADVLAAEGPAALQYGPTEGIAALRATVADRLGNGTAPEGVVITTGSQQALDLVARVLLDPGDVVVVEQPTYLGALGALQWCAPTVVSIAGDHDGLRTDLLADRLAAGLRPKLVYVVTDFANPTGATLADSRRRHLAGLADQFGFVVVEDDPYGALRFRGTTAPPVRAFTERAVTLGTASKVISPGLRVGWLAAPDWLVRPIVVAKQATDLHTAVLNQHLVRALLADGAWFDAHVAALVESYSARAGVLVQALREACGEHFQLSPVDGGMFLWVRPRHPGLAAERLLATAIDAGVAFVPGSAFRHDAVDDGTMRLCFTTVDADGLHEAARRLGAAVGSMTTTV